ncbi:MAG: S1 RNA-binding domain-containing protein [Firmicutes bacterium]|nr:S1 RNA-binding domain-containing protein [Bacillota bacterium]
MLKYEKGKIVTGCVTGVEKYGIFVGLDDFYSGLIHISEISNNFVRNISDYVNIGETIKVKIVEIDEKNYHAKLSIKDIDYRGVYKSSNQVKEVGDGFYPLKAKLDEWIADKMIDINKKNEKK